MELSRRWADGMIIADSSTISPMGNGQICRAAFAAKGVVYVDAQMTGSKIGAADGTLIFMVGGETSVVDRLNPLFRRHGQENLPHGRDRQRAGHQARHEPADRFNLRRLR